MNRRELLRLVTMATGSVLIGSELLLSGCNTTDSNTAFASLTAEEIAFLDEVGETILPATASPGAKAAEVGKFINVMIRDCYETDDQQTFQKGIKELDLACKKMQGKTFLEATAQQREQFLIALDKEAKDYSKKKTLFDNEQGKLYTQAQEKGDLQFKKERMQPHYFTMMKQLVMIGFFTSKTGATQALRHVAVPGRYDGAMEYKKGDKAWSSK
ncbi:gluconate 2-dehydrogenase subunit 3 family protein [Terrimonas sp. NA20]|uniref:Gluconate 2-dehydrogenase subunit 3 family protein n=1 Tax=Terrimonas ginsenosidimutans TaxID=2908004 RepID=A0ABS9KKV8_9BACT|nr:gluconate 2-dehydrogenase subunit 3 family protein [Terrimonas ginsenosidimutans]MCG2612950.1 gluconate 2-dehydrogenase subunit 3 family protein [Terrimonas ginsenosidimutans]